MSDDWLEDVFAEQESHEIQPDGLIYRKVIAPEDMPVDPRYMSGHRAVFTGIKALKTREPLNFPDFAERHYFLAPESSGVAGSWITAPFQRGVMLLFGNNDVAKVVVFKSARVGYTKMLSALVVYALSWKRRSIALWQPTNDDASDFVMDEINPLFGYIPVFAEALATDWKNNKDPLNTQSKKFFDGAVGHFNGGKAAGNYRRITVDIAAIDELDGFLRQVKGAEGVTEGSPVTLARVRVSDSPYPKLILGSTPTVKGSSIIESELYSCEVVLDRYVRCPLCKTHQIMDWGTDHQDFNKPGMKWKPGKPKTARYCCSSCTGLWEWGDINDIDGNGYWASETHRFDDTGDGQFCDLVSGEPVEWPDSVGVKISTLFSPFFSWPQMVNEYLEAWKEAEAGDHGKMNVFVNTRLGQTYNPHDMVLHDPLSLYMRRENYSPLESLPVNVTAIVAGVDVQIDRVEIEIRGFGVGEESWGIQYIRLFGDTSKVPSYDEEGNRTDNENLIWDDMEKLLNRRFHHPIYGEMPIAVACIDSGYQTNNVYSFCARNPQTFIAVKGTGTATAQPIVSFSGQKTERGCYLALVSANTAMDTFHARIGTPKAEDGGSTPGYYHWPRDEISFPEKYFKQMLCEIRIKRLYNGRPMMVWTAPPNAPNEPADTAKYCLAAVKIAQMAKGVTLAAPTAILVGKSPEQGEIAPKKDYGRYASALNKPRAPAHR